MTAASQIPPVVDEHWVTSQGDDVVLADVRWYLDGRSGREAWLGGHLPGAVWVDIDNDLSRPGGPQDGRHPLPSPEWFAAALGRRGIAQHDTVVAYDDAGGSTAARLVWMLRAAGARAAVLDGGLEGWSGPLESGAVERPPTQRAAVPWPAASFVTIEDLADQAVRAAHTVLDARVRGRFTGDEPSPVDARPGHIPGAHNAPWHDNLDERRRFRSAPQLRERYATLGIDEAASVIAYCGSGVTACHDLIALEHAGLGTGRLFTGSWSAWAANPDLRAELGQGPPAGTKGNTR
jgi:thiosulfate/3-mercaptopyruvate sulfurtransferase